MKLNISYRLPEPKVTAPFMANYAVISADSDLVYGLFTTELNATIFTRGFAHPALRIVKITR